MAIIGTIEVLKGQTHNSRLLKGLDYLNNADIDKEFENVSQGISKKVDIDGDKIFAIYQTYISKEHSEIKIEGHQKYIDIQYIHSGSEQILLAPLSAITKPDPYNPENDVYFPEVNSYSLIQLKPMDAAILFPADLHGPGYCIDKPSKVQKIVIKVAVS